jgi:DNA-binding transcriptional regulator YhcF (GntR family)
MKKKRVMHQKQVLSHYVEEQILNWINKEKLHSGDRLISEKEMAARLGVNHLTVRKSLANLAEKNIIESRPRSGTYIKSLPKSFRQTINPKLVALVLSDSAHFHNDILKSIYTLLQTDDYLPVLIPLPDRRSADFVQQIEGKLREFVRMGGVNLVTDASPELLRMYEREFDLTYSSKVEWEHVVWVTNYEVPSNFVGPIIKQDRNQFLLEAVKHLIKLGHKKIAFLTYANSAPPYPSEYCHTVGQYAMTMAYYGLLNGLCVLTQGPNAKKNGERIKDTLMSPNRPTAVIAESDFRLVRLLKNLEECGLKVPKDVALLGNYNTPWAEQYELTSFRYDANKYAQAVLACLRSQTSHDRGKVRHIVTIKPQLVIRKSTAIE